MIARAIVSSDRCSHSPRIVFIMGLLWARENLILHSHCIAFLTSSWEVYSCISPSTTHWTLRTLGLHGSLTVLLISYHILLVSSWCIFCFILVALLQSCLSCESMRQSWRCTLQRPLACCRNSNFLICVSWSPSLSSSRVSALGCLMCLPLAKRIMFPTFWDFPSLSLMSWRYACILSYQIWMVGLKLLSGHRIFRHFFSACCCISFIYLYSLMIMALSQPGGGYPQYLIILSTTSSLSFIRWSSNCSLTIVLYLSTDACCEVTRRLLTGLHTLCQNSPSSDLVDISNISDLWSPGLSLKFSMARSTTSISGDLYLPSMGWEPLMCV